MAQTREELNRFLVEAFHNVLRAEERYLRKLFTGNLSISEMHVIEACRLAEQQGDRSAKGIASLLAITPGSLSISLKALEKKGYLSRVRDTSDRRRIAISLSDKGKKADQAHRLVHSRMVDAVLATLDEHQAEVLSHALRAVTQFFTNERIEAHDETDR